MKYAPIVALAVAAAFVAGCGGGSSTTNMRIDELEDELSEAQVEIRDLEGELEDAKDDIGDLEDVSAVPKMHVDGRHEHAVPFQPSSSASL